MSQLVLSMATRQEPSYHRKLMLKVANSLSREDVADIVYLSEDFVSVDEVAKISSGIDLMRCLERHGRLKPGVYHYLLSCLREVGRIDVANTLSESLQTPLLNLPPSFSVSSQMYRLKLGGLESKKRMYVQHMRHMDALSRNPLPWRANWTTTFKVICHNIGGVDEDSLPAASDIDRVLAAGLEHLTAGMVAKSLGYKKLRDVAEIATAAQHFSEAGKRYEKFYTILNCQNQGQNGRLLKFVRLAVDGCCFVQDFAVELLGKEAVSESTQLVTEGLNTIIANTVPLDRSIVQWLFNATNTIVTSSLNIQKYKPQLVHALSCLSWDYIHTQCYNLIKQIFQGTQIAHIPEIYDPTHSSDDDISVRQLTELSKRPPVPPVWVTLCLNIYILIHVNRLGPGDWGRIRANYQLAEAKLAQMYCSMTEDMFRIFHSLIGSFKRSIVSTVQEHASGLQAVIMDFLGC